MRERVSGVVDLEQVLGRNMGVALRRRERGVAQELLDRAQIRAAVEQVRRARVTERMRMKIGSTGTERAVFVDEQLHGPNAEPPAARRNEDRPRIHGARLRMLQRRADAEIRLQRRHTFSAEGHETLFVSLSADPSGRRAVAVPRSSSESDSDVSSLTRRPEP